MKLGMTKNGKIFALMFWVLMGGGTLIVRAFEGELRTSSFVIIPICYGVGALVFGVWYSRGDRKRRRPPG